MQLFFSIKPTKLKVMGIISPLIDLHIKLLIRLLITTKNRHLFETVLEMEKKERSGNERRVVEPEIVFPITWNFAE